MGRGRRVMKVVGPWRLGVSAFVGMLLCVLVAWSASVIPTNAPPPLKSILWPLYQPPSSAPHYLSLEERSGGADPEIEVSKWFDFSRGSTWSYSNRHTRAHFAKLRMLMGTDPLTEVDPDERPGWIRGVGYARERLGSVPGSYHIDEYAFGYPFRALAARSLFHEPPRPDPIPLGVSLVPPAPDLVEGTIEVPTYIVQTLQLFGTIRTPQGFRPVLPISVAPFGFVMNTIICAIPVYILVSIPACVSGVRRRRTNRCTACGYNLDNLTADTCPECGVGVRRREDA